MILCSMSPERESLAHAQLQLEGYVLLPEPVAPYASVSGARRTQTEEIWNEVTLLRKSLSELREIVMALEERIEVGR